MQESHPKAEILVIEDRPEYDDDDSKLWAQLTLHWLGFVPNAAFTSEIYGEKWAHFKRLQIPMHATWIRQNPKIHLEWLAPAVRAHFVPRVVVLGAESSGTTTLARDLAAHFRSVWVEEYGRECCETYWSGLDYQWQSAEFAHIAGEQQKRENAAARLANRVLICDTNAWTTRLWHERYLGKMSPEVEQIAAKGRADLYLLTDVNIPFVQDGIRDGEAIRVAMQKRFIEELEAHNVPWILVAGEPETRLRRAVAEIEMRLELG